ncbi:dihydroorotate dehydrogenase electron transfer subunit [Sporolactobacillus sp. THM7-4]|nr:dihydroorotate dehydrogenase electron transfer subunit [Sporolactobacillus sp. THM7-4]
MIQEDMLITGQRSLADQIFELKLRGKLAANVSEPGQFVHIRVNGQSGSVAPILRRPISICSRDRAKEEITLIFRSGGLGTDLLKEAEPGERLDVLGPLGHGFPVRDIHDMKKAVVIGGGVGVPPLYGLSAELVKKGVSVLSILGFRSAKDVFYKKEFEELGETVIMTEDGTSGIRGRVTDVLDGMDFDVAYACGPLPMLKAVQRKVSDRPLYISMEQRMGCGIGACLACVVHTTDQNDSKGYRRVCSDGPVFRAGEVELC